MERNSKPAHKKRGTKRGHKRKNSEKREAEKEKNQWGEQPSDALEFEESEMPGREDEPQTTYLKTEELDMLQSGKQGRGKNKKRKLNDEPEQTGDSEDTLTSSALGKTGLPPGFKKRPSDIKNKVKRAEVYRKVLHEKKKLKRKERKQKQKQRELLGDDAPPKQEPKTQDNTREFDETIVRPEDQEVLEDEAIDEFAEHFNGAKEPKILITTSIKPSASIYKFIKEDLMTVLPEAHFYKRGTYEIKQIVEFAKRRDFTDLIVINENSKKMNALLLVHLPEGPTAMFKLTSVVPRRKISGHARPGDHKPELILNNFNTRLGHTVGRMLGSLFPSTPDFKGRSVATFHNQRDFIFFRFHRYIYQGEKKVRLQEIGPRFTLKLRSLQHGTFDPVFGKFEWVYKKELETSRRRFFL
ncbi:Ribosome production factor 1 [Balamuthia mandrillaris]